MLNQVYHHRCWPWLQWNGSDSTVICLIHFHSSKPRIYPAGLHYFSTTKGRKITSVLASEALTIKPSGLIHSEWLALNSKSLTEENVLLLWDCHFSTSRFASLPTRRPKKGYTPLLVPILCLAYRVVIFQIVIPDFGTNKCAFSKTCFAYHISSHFSTASAVATYGVSQNPWPIFWATKNLKKLSKILKCSRAIINLGKVFHKYIMG